MKKGGKMLQMLRFIIVLLLVLPGGSYIYGRLSQVGAQQVCFPEGRTLTVNGVNLHFFERNPGDKKKSVLFLHGASSNARDWKNTLFDHLPESLHLVALDRPGLGHSNATGPLPLAEQTALIHRTVTELNLEQPIVVAHSLSGVIAARLLVDYPESYKGLVIVAGATYPIGDGKSWYTRLATFPIVGTVFRHVVVPSLAPLVSPRLTETSFSPQPVAANYAQESCLNLLFSADRFLANASDLNAIRPYLDESYPLYQTIKQPVSLIYGDSDQLLAQFTHAWGFQYQVPHARIHMLSNQGHMIHFFHPDLIAAEIMKMTEDQPRRE